MPDAVRLASAPTAAPVSAFAPVLASTLLCLDLLRSAPTLDLRVVARLLKRDPCAVLRVYALLDAERTEQERPDAGGPPERLEECLSILNLAGLASALREPVTSPAEQLQLLRFARHASDIASYSEAVAASLALPAHQAYLVGLLHAIGTLPAELGRANACNDGAGQAAAAFDCARLRGLPRALCEALAEVHRDEPTSLWAAAIHAAHDLAGMRHGRRALPP